MGGFSQRAVVLSMDQKAHRNHLSWLTCFITIARALRTLPSSCSPSLRPGNPRWLRTIDGMLIDSVAKRGTGHCHAMIEALRNNDLNALANYRDIAPTQLDSLLSDVSAKVLRPARIRRNDRRGPIRFFAPTVAQALTAVGFGSASGPDVERESHRLPQTSLRGQSCTETCDLGQACDEEIVGKGQTRPSTRKRIRQGIIGTLNPEVPGDSNLNA